MRLLHITPLLLLLLLAWYRVEAQHYAFQEYGVKDGLAASKVYALCEDQNGKIWLGTVNGISLFDGYRFENYTDADGIAPEGVRTIYQDSYGNVWFGHYEGGITRYRDGAFEIVELHDLRSKGDIYDFQESVSGDLWIASNGLGAIRVKGHKGDATGFEVHQYMGSEGLGDRVFDIHVTADGTLYFVTDAGLKKLEDDGSFSFYRPGGMTNMFQLTCMLEDSRGMRWFGTHNGGLYKYAPGNTDIEIIDVMDGLAHNFVFCLHEDANGNIWAGTYGGGVSVISPNGHIQTMNSNNGLPDEKIQCLTADRENNVLIGTNDNGMMAFKSFQFTSFPLPDRFAVRKYNAIQPKAGGGIWLATEKGLVSLDEKGGNATRFGKEEGLGDLNINDIAIARDGTLWLGTEFGGLFSFTPASGRFRSHFAINQYITQNKVTDMHSHDGKVLWIGTLDGLLRVDWERESLDRLTQRDGLNGNHISAISSTREGHLLVGFVGRGAARITPDSTYSLLSTGTPACFLHDDDGTLWVGMEGQGIYLFENAKDPVHLTRSEGLLSNAISTIDQDKQGNFWIGSNLGLTRLDKANQHFVHYTQSAGFMGLEVRKRASFSSGNKLWYGTANGLFLNNPALEKPAQEVGLLRITKSLVNGNPTKKKEQLDLKFDQNELSFQFITVSLSDPQSVRYQTYLEGRDQRWSDWTPNRSVEYLGLPEGTYRFHVRARNRWGEESELSSVSTYVIHPPWYRSTTFYGASGAGLILAFILFVKIRERNLKREKRVLEEKVKERTREVVEKSEELEKKNNDILDSINYAKRIQDAILLPREQIDAFGYENFVLYRPKDIVSGDFYWFSQLNDQLLFAAADCTGHGVPGAFMSVVGHSLLDKIVVEQGITSPELILTNLSEGVEKFLRQKENQNLPRDGMDVALVAIKPVENKILFAGAFNPLYLVRDGEVHEFKADRFSVGSYQDDSQKIFTLHEVEFRAGDCIYVFSDGYVDQFGGPDYKKFKSRNFKELLMSLHGKDMAAQEEVLRETLKEWMGKVQQLDDILVIGMKL